MVKKVLLMHISDTSGHYHASIAIEKALKLKSPDCEVLNINSLNYTNPILDKLINRLYLRMIKNKPEVWDYLYDNPDIVRGTRSLRHSFHKFNSDKLKTLLDTFKPDVVVCTQAFPCGMVADYKKSFGIKLPLVGVLTDYFPHSYWVYDNVDLYVVSSEDARDKFVRDGIDSSKIKVLGIPIKPQFVHSLNRKEIFNRVGLESSLPIILIMGGGQGLGPIKEIVKSLSDTSAELQMIVVAGHNKSLNRWLNKKKNFFGKRLLSFEYVERIDELMEISSLIITKPGGLTTAEALAKGLPMIIVNPIPGQETKNAEFLLSRAAAVKVDSGAEAASTVNALISDNSRLSLLRDSALKCSRPSSAFDIADAVLSSLAS